MRRRPDIRSRRSPPEQPFHAEVLWTAAAVDTPARRRGRRAANRPGKPDQSNTGQCQADSPVRRPILERHPPLPCRRDHHALEGVIDAEVRDATAIQRRHEVVRKKRLLQRHHARPFRVDAEARGVRRQPVPACRNYLSRRGGQLTRGVERPVVALLNRPRTAADGRGPPQQIGRVRGTCHTPSTKNALGHAVFRRPSFRRS